MSSSSVSITVHELSQDPTSAWDLFKEHQKIMKLNVIAPTTPPATNMLRFVCMSDTHSLTSRLGFDIPDGDVFLHAGDFTRCGDEQEVKTFNTWLGSLPHKYKVVIAGNHELSFDPDFNPRLKAHGRSQHTGNNPVDNIPLLDCERSALQAAVATQVHPASLLTNATYLQDSLTSIAGVKIYGSPWQPVHLHWAFNLPRGAPCLEKWSAIPEGVDVLLTHSPPLGHGDLCSTGMRAGCVELLSTVQNRVKPKYHVFGHIHESYGITTDGKIIFVNASTCNVHYRACNPPIVFDVPIPEGHFK